MANEILLKSNTYCSVLVQPGLLLQALACAFSLYQSSLRCQPVLAFLASGAGLESSAAFLGKPLGFCSAGKDIILVLAHSAAVSQSSSSSQGTRAFGFEESKAAAGRQQREILAHELECKTFGPVAFFDRPAAHGPLGMIAAHLSFLVGGDLEIAARCKVATA